MSYIYAGVIAAYAWRFIRHPNFGTVHVTFVQLKAWQWRRISLNYACSGVICGEWASQAVRSDCSRGARTCCGRRSFVVACRSQTTILSLSAVYKRLTDATWPSVVTNHTRISNQPARQADRRRHAEASRRNNVVTLNSNSACSAPATTALTVCYHT